MFIILCITVSLPPVIVPNDNDEDLELLWGRQHKVT